jgi:hypothetical protein
VVACTASGTTESALWSWAGTAIEVIKKWIGHGSEEMIRRYTHFRPDFMQDELARVPDFAFEFGSKIAVIDPFDPKLQAVA